LWDYLHKQRQLGLMHCSNQTWVEQIFYKS
jgi:hypothetical protein